ncbi:MAG: prephenate dehydrogenase/arogenate dehydrogenase family protein [Planctomycetaceae bacterium]|nr:prephenate dehydrogenase/arogenate dehydrogenase family protein [Planctomycetaceae bacterium]
MSDAPSTAARFDTLAVVGVGLLGGSVAMAARSRGLVRRVIGVGRSRERLEAAREAAVIDSAETILAAISRADLVVVCTPVDRIVSDIVAAARIVGDGGTVTDVGSVKGAIVRDISTSPGAYKFVPSHPLAGSEQTGWQAGSAQLFQDRLCVITPFDGIDPKRLSRVEAFWQALGMRTTQVGPGEHDRLLALTSHLPHAVAAALASLVGAAERPFAATGFRDTTRIAAGDPAVWTPILLQNSGPLLESLGDLRSEIEKLESAIQQGDSEAVSAWLSHARQLRSELNS